MTVLGWVFMLGSWLVIISFLIFCYSRVLKKGI